MTAIDTNLVVLDVVTAWSIDAVAFLTAGLGFLAWSIAVRGPWRSLPAFAIEVVVGLLVERLASTLHPADRLIGASPLPAGARRGSSLGYTIRSAGAVAAACAVTAGVASALSAPQFAGGWFAAFGIVRLVATLRARRMEHRARVEYRVKMGSWRRRAAEYYVTSPAF